MGRGDVVIDDRCQVQCDVIFCHADLTRDLDDLDLDIDLDEAFGERVDLDKARVDSAREATKFGYQADITLRDRLVRVGADDAARNGSAETNQATKIID